MVRGLKSSLSGRSLIAIEFGVLGGLTWQGKAGSLGPVDEESKDSDRVKDEAGEGIDGGGPIECRVTAWYFRRMGLMTLMLLGMASYFLYDGLVGYPKSNRKVDIYDAFHAGKDGGKSWESVVEKLGLNAEGAGGENALAGARDAFDAAKGGAVWTGGYSLERGLPEKPERKSEHDIREQFHYAWALIALGGIVIFITLLNVRKKVTADHEAFYTTKGRRVPFEAIYRLDKRKWDNKGLAYLYYEDEKDRRQKAVIDDLKFQGADRVLNRILAVFDGELVERLYIDDDEEEGVGTVDLAKGEASGAEDKGD
jgi:hypothetical protein